MNVKMMAALLALGSVFMGGMLLRPEVTPQPSGPRMLEEQPVQLENGGEMVLAANETLPVAPVQPAEAAPAPTFPEVLVSAGWDQRVGANRAVWVSVSAQEMVLFDGRQEVWRAACGTASNGIGSEMGSKKTPLGWHVIVEKKGDGAPWGQVFRSRIATKEVWKPGQSTKEDLVLTRLLWLDGLEPGKNKGKNAAGKNVDSKERCIYIHGTNAEELIGTPSSHGCIRLTNDNVIAVYEMLPVGTLVLITE